MFAYQSWLSRTSLRSPNKASVSSNRRIAGSPSSCVCESRLFNQPNRVCQLLGEAAGAVSTARAECVTLLAAHRRAVEDHPKMTCKLSLELAVDHLTVDPLACRSIESRLWWLGA
jgi:hypothetical protein